MCIRDSSSSGSGSGSGRGSGSGSGRGSSSCSGNSSGSGSGADSRCYSAHPSAIYALRCTAYLWAGIFIFRQVLLDVV